MARIPISPDVAQLIGDFAEAVQNRSLLLDKFVFHKDWGLDDLRSNDAHRWTLMRISDGGTAALHAEADRRRRDARGQDREEHNRVRLQREAQIAAKLAATRIEAEDAQKLRARHTRRFLGLFRSACGERAALTIGQLEGRLAINLAESLIQNAGMCLDRLFGLPFIPGSAIKGVSRHAALEELKCAKGDTRAKLFDAFRLVFGTADNDFANGELRPFRLLLAGCSENQKGAISFLPAYPVNDARVVVDLTNVHYPDYYRSGRTEDLSSERPQPNPFPAVEAGAQFAFCLVLNGVAENVEVLTYAKRWLESALTISGLGAKTASGYGWFALRPDVLQQILAEERREAEIIAGKARAEAEAKAKAAAEEKRQAALSPEDRATEALLKLSDEAFAAVAKDLAARPEHEQRAFLRLLREHKDKRERWKTWKKKKPDQASVIESVRKKLNAPPLP